MRRRIDEKVVRQEARVSELAVMRWLAPPEARTPRRRSSDRAD